MPLYFAAVVSIFFLLFASPILSGRRLDVYHTSTHNVASMNANLERGSEMRCTRLAENTGRKNSPSVHHGANLSGNVFATKACIDTSRH